MLARGIVWYSFRREEWRGGELVVVDGSLEDYHPAQSRTDPGTWKGGGGFAIDRMNRRERIRSDMQVRVG